MYAELNQALGEAETDMLANIGAFTSTFAPQMTDNTALIKEMLDLLSFATGLGSAAAWNLCEIPQPNVQVHH
jgi:hypothetical protein